VTASVFWRFIRPVTLPAPVAGVIGGALAATFHADAAIPVGRIAAAVASALALTGASNIVNQIADIETDRINRPERPLPAGEITMRQAWIWFVALGSAALFLGAMVNPAYFACIVVTLPVTVSYSLPPLRFKRLPFVANVVIATPRGLLLVVAGWAAGGGFLERDAWVLGALAWLYLVGAATTKDFADVEGDRATGCLTLPILWGQKRAAWFVAPFLVLPFLGYPAAAALGWLDGSRTGWIILGGALAGLGLIAAALLIRNPAGPESGRPHPAWGLMYLQLTFAHVGAAAVYAAA